MISKTIGIKKRRLLKFLAAFTIAAAAFGILAIAFNANLSDTSNTQSYKDSEKNLNTVIAQELGKDPNRLNVEDFLKLEKNNVYPNELTDLNPLAKLKNLNTIYLYIAPNQYINLKPLAKLGKLSTLVIQLNTGRTLSPSIGLRFLPIIKKQNWYRKVFSFFRRFKPAQSELYSLDISQLKKIRNLESLTVRGFELKKIKALTALKNLKSLEIGPSDSYIGLVSGTVAYAKQKKVEPVNLSPLKNMPKLLHFDISGVKARDYDFIGQLKNLNYLQLQGTPIRDIKQLSGLLKLEYLGLQRTNITDINSLANLTSLKSLDLSYTKIENIDSLVSLGNLQSLELGDTKVKDIKTLSKLTSLQRLTLNNLTIVDIAPLKGLVNLERLSLSGAKINNIEPIAKLVNLNTLYLSNMDVNDLDPLTGLNHLRMLILSRIPIRDISLLGNLTSLQKLTFYEMIIDDIRPIGKLKNLKSLDLRKTPVNKDEVEELKKMLPGLSISLD